MSRTTENLTQKCGDSLLETVLLSDYFSDNVMVVPTFYFFNLSLPGYAGCFEVLKVSFKLDKFLGKKVNINIIHAIIQQSCRSFKCHQKLADYLGHHDFECIQLPASSFPKSSFELFNKLLGLPIWPIRENTHINQGNNV